MSQKWEEIILVAPNKYVFGVNESLRFQGIETDQVRVRAIVENIANTFFEMRRGHDKLDPAPKENNAEINTDLKQPIPYVVLKRDNQVYGYERLTGGGESRLHNKISIGAGGHMNNFDNEDFYTLLSMNLERELEEELHIDGERLSLDTIGLINDDENEVGRVHIGLLVIAELARDAEVSVRETDQLKGAWFNIEDLKQQEVYERLESWSQFVVDILNN